MKKVIALIAAAAIIITSLNILVFANSESSVMTSQEYYTAQSYLIDKFCNGDITFVQWQEQQTAINTEFLETNKSVGDTAYALAVTTSNQFSGISQKISKSVEQWGDGARERVSDWWNGVCNNNNVPTEQTQTSTTPTYGCGARIDSFDIANNRIESIMLCDYIQLYPAGTNSSYTNFRAQSNDGLTVFPYASVSGGGLNKDGSFSYWNSGASSFKSYSYSETGGYLSTNGRYLYKLYGDVRGFDGEQAPTSDEWEYSVIKNFDDMSERDLEDLLNDFAEEMERQNPDLSSIEGLLNAIYARLGTLDSDDDNGLLSQINTSIQSLNASISGIETSINDLKETITSLFSNGDKKDDDNIETEKHEISGTLYNVIPLEKNWIQKITHDKTNLHVEYQGKEYYLESDGTLLLDGKYYNVDMNYASTLDEILYTLLDIRDSLELLTEEEKQMSFSDFFDLKVNDFKLDLDEKFAFKDNLKDFVQNFFDEFNSSVPVYESGV